MIGQITVAVKERVKRQIMQKIEWDEYQGFCAGQERLQRTHEHFVECRQMVLNVEQSHGRPGQGRLRIGAGPEEVKLQKFELFLQRIS